VAVCVVLQEKHALLQQGFDQQASRLQRQIDCLKSEMQEEQKSKPSKVSRILDGVSATAELIVPSFVP